MTSPRRVCPMNRPIGSAMRSATATAAIDERHVLPEPRRDAVRAGPVGGIGQPDGDVLDRAEQVHQAALAVGAVGAVGAGAGGSTGGM